MSKFAELVAVIRGILKVSNAVKTEDLNRRRDDFIRDNLRMENNGAGVIVTDAKYDYTPITDKTTPIPATQLAYVKEEIYDYLGVSKEIVENTATPQQEQAFYSGEIAPFFRRLSQAFSNVLFTEREFGYGNRIVFSANSVQFATLPEKVTAVVTAWLRSTGAPSVCHCAGSAGVPTGTDRLDGTLKMRTSLNSPFVSRACLITSFKVWVGITAALLDRVLKLSERFSVCAAE